MGCRAVFPRGRRWSDLLAFHLHLSGVIATASAGLVLGNFGSKRGMSARTRTAMESFWEYVSFVMNSLVFLLIGLEIHVRQLLRNWTLVALAVGAVLVGRVLSVYLFVPLSNRFAEKIPFRWQLVVYRGHACDRARSTSEVSAFACRTESLIRLAKMRNSRQVSGASDASKMQSKLVSYSAQVFNTPGGIYGHSGGAKV
jgi:hypothetical protein